MKVAIVFACTLVGVLVGMEITSRVVKRDAKSRAENERGLANKMEQYTLAMKTAQLKFIKVYADPDFVNTYFELNEHDQQCFRNTSKVAFKCLNNDEKKARDFLNIICPNSLEKYVVFHHGLERTAKALKELYDSILRGIPVTVWEAVRAAVIAFYTLVDNTLISPEKANLLAGGIVHSLSLHLQDEDLDQLVKNFPVLEPVLGDAQKNKEFLDYLRGVSNYIQGFMHDIPEEFFSLKYKVEPRLEQVVNNVYDKLLAMKEHKYDEVADKNLDVFIEGAFKQYNLTAPVKCISIFF